MDGIEEGTLEDLSGSADERMQRLLELEAEGTLPPQWVRDQLTLALKAWAEAETRLGIEDERREDY
ncbi:hypothetical protein GCM10010988_03130 [Cnuibacter physcomitrellae]|uniref:Uncharacterized protein n=1 Tax=Cnuibacter physcomitrellae TaxID=1619308 RepID=A0A1X9LJC6_9MICO|nr:hypothetical protein B5808_08500 [Cnuibacter physcomitrellae]GGI35279.1 hypothetical protein GCM10010988_03130 [Cnuibacter physcomitrellae]